MVLIFSHNSQESTTDEVIEWLDYLGYDFIRFNGVNFIKHCHVEMSNKTVKVKLKNIDWKGVKVVWLRRWMSVENSKDIYLDINTNTICFLRLQLNEHLREENRALTDFLFDYIPSNLKFSELRTSEINKLKVLAKAREIGLHIPETYILTEKQKLKNLSEVDLVNKAIANSAMLKIDKQLFVSYTTDIDSFRANLKESFAPSLFQNKVNKKYEIRSFYLQKKIYSMAIFSQDDKQTSVDFRKYNYGFPNRISCFKLPNIIENKLIKIARFFKLNAASFDLIKDKENNYIFLEVNPGGQFEMTSKPCNYFLEKLVAEELIKF